MRVLGALVLLLSLLGCAQPKYVNVTSQEAGQNKPSDLESLCQLRFSGSKLCVHWRWEVPGNSQDAGSIIFKVFRQSEVDLFPIAQEFEFHPSLILWMESMGHGSSKTKIETLDIGVFRATNVYFVMPGEWQLKFRVYDGRGNHEDAIAEILVD